MASASGFPPGRTAPMTIADEIADDTEVVPGVAIQITCSVAGEVVLTLASDKEIIITPGTGDSIYPYAVKRMVNDTATVTRAYNLR